MNQILKAELLAKQWHDVDANQKYNGHSYSIHLQHVVNIATKFAHLLPIAVFPQVIAACWLHDSIEDARKTYSDIKEHFDVVVAEIVYALTNEKGKNRRERANDRYYQGIRDIPFAAFVKMCDRIANVEYSIMSNNKVEMYRKENDAFIQKVSNPQLAEMAEYLEGLFTQVPQ